MPPAPTNHRRPVLSKKAAPASRVRRPSETFAARPVANEFAPATGAAPSSASTRNYIAGRTTPSSRMRARFNPIRHLSPESLARALEAFQAGDLRLAALLWDAMERRDDVLRNVSLKRKKAAARLDWEILSLDDSPAAGRHREALLAFYNNLTATHACDPQERGGVALLVKQMLDAVGKKYAVHEILWQPLPGSQPPTTSSLEPSTAKGAPRATDAANELSAKDGSFPVGASAPARSSGFLTATFRFAPLWFFEARTGPLRFLPEDTATEGLDLTAGQWLVTVGDGLMEASSIAYLFKHLPLRDWLVYCERNGMPGVRAVTDAAPGTAEWDAAREAVRDFGAEFHALMSRGTEIEPIDLSTRGELPYPALVERMDRALAALWRGADLATLAKGQGLGASVQAEETALLEQDDAALVSETLNTQVDAPLLRQLFGEETPRAYFRLLPRQESERSAYLNLLERLARLNLPLPVEGLYERLGLPKPPDTSAAPPFTVPAPYPSSPPVSAAA